VHHQQSRQAPPEGERGPFVQAPDPRERGSQRSGGPGLVHPQTSDTQNPLPDRVIPLDPAVTRLRRMRKALITGAGQHQEAAQRGGFRVKVAMLTLTYRPGLEYRPRHVSEMLKRVRHWLARRGEGLRAEWCLELTQAGRPHYHVLVWLPRGLTLPKPDKRGWWPHGLTRIEWARRPVGYIAKYASKGTKGHALPRGSRVFAVLGLDAQGRRVKRWWCAPGWVRSLWPDAAADVSPAPGGGWVARATGEWHPSPWVIRFADGRLWAVQAVAPPD
jgi:hypothetical protein